MNKKEVKQEPNNTVHEKEQKAVAILESDSDADDSETTEAIIRQLQMHWKMTH